ncbi:hypothetical protein IQ255_04755 [Pleurocapsales cyanobacterium LEGE 10410]|nr:hypothetical protein [Pleurocapsales cyanobacterium LEGE 10410]
MNPNNWFTVWSFILFATLLSLSFGWLVNKEQLSIRATMGFGDRQKKFIQVWARVAVLIGIIVPLVLLITFWDVPILRQFFGYYLFVVAVQLGCEVSFSRILCQSVVVVIGTLYTGFRIWQLWSGLQLMADAQPWLGLLWLVLLFWVANLIMLFTLAIPSILPEYELETKDKQYE